MKYFILVTILILFGLKSQVYAFEAGCSLKPNQLNEYGTKITEIVDSKNGSLPDTIPLQSDFRISSRGGQKTYKGTFEGFFRPLIDDFISITPLPFVGFDISRDRVVLYVCAHYSDKKEDNHVTIYFLRGYHIDPKNLRNFIGDYIYDPSLKVKAVPATLIGISEFRKFFVQIFRILPFVDIYFETISLLQQALAGFIGDITGLGVERIEITDKFVRVSSIVDLNSPRDARRTTTFTPKRPQLGPGADPNRSITRSSTEEALSELEKNTIEYEVEEVHK